MKLFIRKLSDKGVEENEFRNALEIELEDKSIKLEFADTESLEDANMSRDFSDVRLIQELVLKANKLGLEGNKLEIIEEDLEW